MTSMTNIDIKYCPGTLAAGYDSYNNTCLRRVFNGKKVSFILPYDSPVSTDSMNDKFVENQKRISISGVQEKYSIILEKNKLRLIEEGEQGEFILKPIPSGHNKNLDQMPANEHLTMQIARQAFNIETAENALIFFKNGHPAYITKRFDVDYEQKLATEDFASLAGRTPQTDGENYKYKGNYLEFFDLMKKLMPAYIIESIKLFKLLVFNYLFSNGDAHYKNFSLLETNLGDHRLAPAYDLINTRIHVEDSDFALNDGLLPINMVKRKIRDQFYTLAEHADIDLEQVDGIFYQLTSKSKKVDVMINASYLAEKIKRNYRQSYQRRLKKLSKKS